MTTSGNFKFKPKLFKFYVEQFTLPESYGPSNYQITFIFPPKWKFWDKPYVVVTNIETMAFRYMSYDEAATIGTIKPQRYEDICLFLDRNARPFL